MKSLEKVKVMSLKNFYQGLWSSGAGSWPRKTLISELGQEKANDLFDLEAVRRYALLMMTYLKT